MKTKEETSRAKLSSKDIEIVKASLKGAPELEIERFIRICERTGLDPISKQIYGRVQQKKVSEKKGDQWVDKYVPELIIITGIDGFRAIAEMSGEYRGQTPPEWLIFDKTEGEGPRWQDWCAPTKTPQGDPIQLPIAARVGVYREGFNGPVMGYAAFDSFAAYEYKYKNEGGKKVREGKILGQFWRRMPEHQIAKCAEAQAFRKAFPFVFSGVYIEEEIHSMDETTEAEIAPASTGEEPLPGTVTEVIGKPPTQTKKAARGGQAEAPPAREPSKPKQAHAPVDEPLPGGAPEPGDFDESELDGGPVGEALTEPQSLGYVIKAISSPQYLGKKLGDLSMASLENLVVKWAKSEKAQVNINADPAKKIERDNVIHAYEYRLKRGDRD